MLSNQQTTTTTVQLTPILQYGRLYSTVHYHTAQPTIQLTPILQYGRLYSTVHCYTQPSPPSNLLPVSSMEDCTVHYNVTQPSPPSNLFPFSSIDIVQYSTLHKAQPNVQLTIILQYGRLHSAVHYYTQPSPPSNLRRVILPSSLKLLLPVHPGLVLGVHIVLVDGVLVGEGALHLTDVVVNLLAAILVDRAADGPDHAELEPQLHHPCEVFCVHWVHLHIRQEWRKYNYRWSALLASFS